MQFTVQYDEQTIRYAVNSFFWRRLTAGLGWPGLLAIALSCASLLFLLWQGDRSWIVGAIGTVLVLVLLLFVAIWGWRHAEMRTKLAAIPSRQGHVTLTGDRISIATEAGSTELRWDTFTELWKLDGCWLLFLAPNNFVTLPTKGLSQEALDYVDSHLGTSCEVR